MNKNRLLGSTQGRLSLAGALAFRRFLVAFVHGVLGFSLNIAAAGAYAANALPARWLVDGNTGRGCGEQISVTGFNSCTAAYQYFAQIFRTCNPTAGISDNPCPQGDFQDIWAIFPLGSWNPYARVRSYCDDPSAGGARFNATNGYHCDPAAYSRRLNAGAPRYCPGCLEGNPVHPAIGNKFQVEPDYTAQGPFPLQFVRYHNTLLVDATGGAIGANWTHTYSRRLLCDTGMAIPKADQQRIFERFYRMDDARSREVGGTGLGLSISKHLIEAHAGRIELVSQVGQGSTFSIVLPLSEN